MHFMNAVFLINLLSLPRITKAHVSHIGRYLLTPFIELGDILLYLFPLLGLRGPLFFVNLKIAILSSPCIEFKAEESCRSTKKLSAKLLLLQPSQTSIIRTLLHKINKYCPAISNQKLDEKTKKIGVY